MTLTPMFGSFIMMWYVLYCFKVILQFYNVTLSDFFLCLPCFLLPKMSSTHEP